MVWILHEQAGSLRRRPPHRLEARLEACVTIGCLLLACTAAGQTRDDYEKPPISYSDTAANDPIARLQTRLNAREVAFSGSEPEVVRALLKELQVPEASQLLVFSKTSLQRTRTAPENPRAIYFNDHSYVGWVPGGLVEMASIDPQLGPIFYAFDPREKGDEPPRFRRDANCLSCHGANFTRDIPGVFARSVFTQASGSPIFSAGTEVVDYTTPFDQRWGGWYVTGRHGSARHRGNAFAREEDGEAKLDVERGANLMDLSRFFDPGGYLAPTSDLVALLVFEHQIAAHNAMTRAQFDARRMLAYQRSLQESLKEPVTDEPTYDSVKRVVARAAQDVLDVLLFKDEAALPKEGVEGAPAFRHAYEAAGPATADGRSLRALELKSRLARWRCSPLIYGEQFRALPAPVRKLALERLEALLTADEPEARYAYLGAEERKTIAAILEETAPDLFRGREQFSSRGLHE